MMRFQNKDEVTLMAQATAKVAAEELRQLFRSGEALFILLCGIGLGVSLCCLAAYCVLGNMEQKPSPISTIASTSSHEDEPFIKLHDTLGETADGEHFHLGMTLYRVEDCDGSPNLHCVETSNDSHAVFVADKTTNERFDLSQLYADRKIAVERRMEKINADFEKEERQASRTIAERRAAAIGPVQALLESQ